MTERASDLFEDIVVLPDAEAQRLYHSLVGLDTVKDRLTKEARILLRPGDLAKWSQHHYGLLVPLTATFRDRLPLFVFAGDVGTGKTALAETFGDAVARNLDVQVTRYRLSLTARGTGAVGQMTALIAGAFKEIEDHGKQIALNDGNPSAAIVLVIDEADALAQSRELSQMHHEDRAGVNALIRGVDKFGGGTLPILVVMCTNRLSALDPAVLRRAADTFVFHRPTLDQRKSVLEANLAELGFSDVQFGKLAEVTGESEGRSYGCTYSDLTQRLLPQCLLAAFPNSPLDYEQVFSLAQSLEPTTPFTGNTG